MSENQLTCNYAPAKSQRRRPTLLFWLGIVSLCCAVVWDIKSLIEFYFLGRIPAAEELKGSSSFMIDIGLMIPAVFGTLACGILAPLEMIFVRRPGAWRWSLAALLLALATTGVLLSFHLIASWLLSFSGRP